MWKWHLVMGNGVLQDILFAAEIHPKRKIGVNFLGNAICSTAYLLIFV